MEENQHIIRHNIVRVVLFLAEQELPLRGDIEEIQS